MKAQIRGLVPTKMFPKTTSLHTFVLAVLFLTTALTGRALPVSFRSEIAPLLLAQCQGCHGAEKAKGDYRVDSYTELMRALEEEPPRVQAGTADRCGCEPSAWAAALRLAAAGCLSKLHGTFLSAGAPLFPTSAAQEVRGVPGVL